MEGNLFKKKKKKKEKKKLLQGRFNKLEFLEEMWIEKERGEEGERMFYVFFCFNIFLRRE